MNSENIDIKKMKQAWMEMGRVLGMLDHSNYNPEDIAGKNGTRPPARQVLCVLEHLFVDGVRWIRYILPRRIHREPFELLAWSGVCCLLFNRVLHGSLALAGHRHN